MLSLCQISLKSYCSLHLISDAVNTYSLQEQVLLGKNKHYSWISEVILWRDFSEEKKISYYWNSIKDSHHCYEQRNSNTVPPIQEKIWLVLVSYSLQWCLLLVLPGLKVFCPHIGDCSLHLVVTISAKYSCLNLLTFIFNEFNMLRTLTHDHFCSLNSGPFLKSGIPIKNYI